MSAQLSLSRYNLTLLVTTPESGAHLKGDVGEFEAAMVDPVLADDGQTILSVRSQLVLALRPPQVVLTDESGTNPSRSAFISASAAIAQMFLGRGFAIQAYGWNFQGVFSGLDPAQVLRDLVAKQRIQDALGDEFAWAVPQLQIAAGSSLADQLNITVQGGSPSFDQPELAFNVNARLGRSPALDQLGEQGTALWDASSQVLFNLFAKG